MIRIFPDITAYLEIMLGGSKMKSIFSIGKDFDRYKDEVNRHNGNMIEIMLYGGILMTILAILAQLFMGYLSAMLLAVSMLILVLLRRPVLSKIQNKTLRSISCRHRSFSQYFSWEPLWIRIIRRLPSSYSSLYFPCSS